MIYLYLFLTILLLVAVTIFSISRIRKSHLPGNAKIIVDVWKSVSRRSR